MSHSYWFDQSELVGGDAWDSKIRQQIAACALFVPVISASTQARREGYFRLEWKLAAQRTHMIADGTPFLLPVVIDDTRDAQALVPPEFKSVQWTRLAGGDTPPAFCARVRRLLEEAEAEALPPAGEKSPTTAPAPATPPKRKRAWIGYAVAAVGIAAGLSYATRSLWSGSPAHDPRSTPPAAPEATAPASASSPAREQARRALELVQALEATREDFALADDFAQRALKLDAMDGVVWAMAAQVHAAFIYRGWDTSPERRELNRSTAERAMRLAPNSPEAKLAQAGAWNTLGINRAEIEKLLREVVAARPDDKAALRFLAVTVMINGRFDECLALNERAAALPGGDPLALFNNARYLWQRGRSEEAFAALERSLAQRPFNSSLVLKAVMEIFRRGDLAAAEAALARIPQSSLLEDRANYVSGLIPYYRRDAEGALKAWGVLPREYYSDFMFDGPKGMLIGLAYELGGRPAAAEAEWRAALRTVEKRLATAPNKPERLYEKSYLLACLGEKAAAEECLRTYLQLVNERPTPGTPMSFELALLYARLGRLDEVFASFPSRSLTRIRLDPRFDALRADSRFAQYREASSPVAASQTGTDRNSVAVLAFANLSDDKANEYFSDGISEELLNVLAQVPGLKVSARTSAFFFKGKEVPIPEIARQLGVAYVVEGSVRKAGDKVRITAQLIKAADGFHVWSDTFTRDLKDIFAVQDEIAGLIAQNLRAKLATTRERPAPAPAVYALILQARHAAAAQTNEGARQALPASPRAGREAGRRLGGTGPLLRPARPLRRPAHSRRHARSPACRAARARPRAGASVRVARDGLGATHQRSRLARRHRILPARVGECTGERHRHERRGDLLPQCRLHRRRRDAGDPGRRARPAQPAGALVARGHLPLVRPPGAGGRILPARGRARAHGRRIPLAPRPRTRAGWPV